METLARQRILTELDHVRLSHLLERRGGPSNAEPSLRDVAALLDGAALVPSRQMAADVVTMGSRVLLSDPRTGRQRTLTLCYPGDAAPADGFVSVLAPVGASLLGLRVGDTAHWRTPVGDDGSAEVLAIPFQPEASGDYTT